MSAAHCCGFLLMFLTLWTVGAVAYDTDEQEEESTWHSPLSDLRLRRAGGCSGFPCIMSQLGDTTGRRATYSMIVDVLGRCVRDPHCGPGKRSAVPIDLTQEKDRWSQYDRRR